MAAADSESSKVKVSKDLATEALSGKRPQFGNRLLDGDKDVFQHNAWDNVVWDEEQEAEALSKVASNSESKFTDEKREQYEADADAHWDKFYDIHQNRFFKDRHWLFTEFPELAPDLALDSVPERVGIGQEPESGELQEEVSAVNGETERDVESGALFEEEFPGAKATYRIFEVGCGAGNTVFPVLQTNNNPGLFIYCCDFSSVAINIVKDHPDFDEARCHPFVGDVSRDDVTFPFPEKSLDVIVMIFVLSAIEPGRMQPTLDRLAALLKPGGLIVLRDYGRYDLAQLRFKKGQCIGEHFYARGDGTRCYFFSQEDLRRMMTSSGLVEVQNLMDRRLQVNRGKQLKMYRVWVQCKYRKPVDGGR